MIILFKTKYKVNTKLPASLKIVYMYEHATETE